jgi:hypothetical protein
MDRVANSTPIVDLESKLNSLRVNRLSRLDFPTPESPIRTTLKRKSYSSLAMMGDQLLISRSSGTVVEKEEVEAEVGVDCGDVLRGPDIE